MAISLLTRSGELEQAFKARVTRTTAALVGAHGQFYSSGGEKWCDTIDASWHHENGSWIKRDKATPALTASDRNAEAKEDSMIPLRLLGWLQDPINESHALNISTKNGMWVAALEKNHETLARGDVAHSLRQALEKLEREFLAA